MIRFGGISTAALQRHASKAKVAAVFVVIKVHFQRSLNIVRIGSKQTSEKTKNPNVQQEIIIYKNKYDIMPRDDFRKKVTMNER